MEESSTTTATFRHGPDRGGEAFFEIQAPETSRTTIHTETGRIERAIASTYADATSPTVHSNVTNTSHSVGLPSEPSIQQCVYINRQRNLEELQVKFFKLRPEAPVWPDARSLLFHKCDCLRQRHLPMTHQESQNGSCRT